MKQPAKPLNVVPAVLAMPDAADVASSLVVEWREAGDDQRIAIVNGVSMWVTNESTTFDRWGWNVRGVGKVDGRTAMLTEAEAKRAAVLALAAHLSQQFAKAVEVVGSASGAEACDCPPPAGEQPHDANCPQAVAPKPFAVGDRVRVKEDRVYGTTLTTTDVRTVRAIEGEFVRVGVTEDSFATFGLRPDHLEHVEAKPAPRFEWSAPIKYDGCLPARFATLPDGRVARDNGDSLYIYSEMNRAVTAEGGTFISDCNTFDKREKGLAACLVLAAVKP